MEHIRIVNFPFFVPNGTQTCRYVDKEEICTDNFEENPEAALNLIVSQTLPLIGKGGQNIIPNKRGNTTTIIYPFHDGFFQYAGTNADWSTLHDAASATTVSTTDTDEEAMRLTSGSTSNKWNVILRAGYSFDTSSITSANVVDSATLSLYEAGANTINNFSESVNVVSFAPTDSGAYAAGDYNKTKWGTTVYASKALSSVTTNAYNDFVLSAAGESYIDLDGITVFGTRGNGDMIDTPPTWAASTNARMWIYFNNNTGTTNDPKLTIVHSAAPPPSPTPQPATRQAVVMHSSSTAIMLSMLALIISGVGIILVKKNYD